VACSHPARVPDSRNACNSLASPSSCQRSCTGCATRLQQPCHARFPSVGVRQAIDAKGCLRLHSPCFPHVVDYERETARRSPRRSRVQSRHVRTRCARCKRSMGLVTYNRAMPLDDATTRSRRIVRAACPHDCPDTCAMLVTVEDGRAIDIRGAPDHPPTAGTLCTKVARYLERTYSPDRLRYPMRRVGAKGEGRFARISWDDALGTIAARFKSIAASVDGPQAILPYSYAGTMGLLQGSSMDRRFFHRLGASLLDRTICASAGKAGWAAVIGASMGMDLEEYTGSRLILHSGSNRTPSTADSL